MPPVDLESLSKARPGESSETVRRRVVSARHLQHRRLGRTGPRCNARMGPADLDRFALLGTREKRLLLQACERMGLSARGFDRVRRVARTLADLEGADSIGSSHVAEAIQYRHPAGFDRY